MGARKITQLVYNKNIPKWGFHPAETNAKKVYYYYSCGNHSDEVRSGYISSWWFPERAVSCYFSINKIRQNNEGITVTIQWSLPHAHSPKDKIESIYDYMTNAASCANTLFIKKST